MDMGKQEAILAFSQSEKIKSGLISGHCKTMAEMGVGD